MTKHTDFILTRGHFFTAGEQGGPQTERERDRHTDSDQLPVRRYRNQGSSLRNDSPPTEPPQVPGEVPRNTDSCHELRGVHDESSLVGA